MTTQVREPEMGLTFEKVWAMFQESDRRMQELNEETVRQMRETDRKIQKLTEETHKQIGELGHRFGELAEHLVAANIVQKFNDLGFHFDDISAGLLRRVIKDENNRQQIAEFDILLENDDSIIGV
ncbi:MAG: hypothetical protein LBG12_14235, partial [Synergistaceae bacterium]|nr:hypothetical protein [Synergistaceae bacterium]